MSETVHPDVAAYALGLLDAESGEHFEEHLLDCEACAADLEWLVPMAGLLARAQGRFAPGLAEAPPETPAESGPRSRAARRPRARAVMRTLLPAAASLGILVVGSALATTYWQRPGEAGIAPTPSASSPAVVVEGRAVDPTTGVRAGVILTAQPWGTQVDVTVREIEGPQECRLLAVLASGGSEVLSTWRVPPGGYGTQRRPQPLVLGASLAVDPADIAELQVQSLRDAEPRTLVTVRL